MPRSLNEPEGWKASSLMYVPARQVAHGAREQQGRVHVQHAVLDNVAIHRAERVARRGRHRRARGGAAGGGRRTAARSRTTTRLVSRSETRGSRRRGGRDQHGTPRAVRVSDCSSRSAELDWIHSYTPRRNIAGKHPTNAPSGCTAARRAVRRARTCPSGEAIARVLVYRVNRSTTAHIPCRVATAGLGRRPGSGIPFSSRKNAGGQRFVG